MVNNVNFLTKQKHFLTIRNILKNKSIIHGVVITLFFMLIYHIGTMITLPGITLPQSYHQQAKTSFLSTIDLLAAGGFDKMSIFAIGLGPYITAQIIIQLLSSDLIKPLKNLASAGEYGKRKIEIIIRLLTLPFCLIQSYAILAMILNSNSSGSRSGIKIFGCEEIRSIPIQNLISLMFLLSAGTYIAIFFSDMITKRGIGNGMTTLILGGIVGSLYRNFNYAFNSIKLLIIRQNRNSDQITIFLSFFLYLFIYLVLLIFIIFVNGTIRKIPIQQTGQGLILDKKQLPFFTIKLNSVGVIPVIFASSLITIPGTIAQFFKNNGPRWFIEKWLTLNSWVGIVIFFFFIIIFTFFYSYVQINPMMIADNFQKSGKFILGIKLGNDTEKHISTVLYRINCLGGPILAIIAIIPYIISLTTKIPTGMALGGTANIIMVTTCLELLNSIKSIATTSGYNITKKNIDYSNNNKSQKDITSLW